MELWPTRVSLKGNCGFGFLPLFGQLTRTTYVSFACFLVCFGAAERIHARTDRVERTSFGFRKGWGSGFIRSLIFFITVTSVVLE